MRCNKIFLFRLYQIQSALFEMPVMISLQYLFALHILDILVCVYLDEFAIKTWILITS